MEEVQQKSRRELKRNRVRTYFLEAAKTIIIKEGAENISVRRVADAAGYSYPTLYSYFRDMNELLWEVRELMISDIIKELKQRISMKAIDADGIKKILNNYIEYFSESPNVFKFLYSYKIQRSSPKQQPSSPENNFEALLFEALKCIPKDGRLKEKDIETIAKTLYYAVHGMLALSLSDDKYLKDQAHLVRDLNVMADYLLSEKLEKAACR